MGSCIEQFQLAASHGFYVDEPPDAAALKQGLRVLAAERLDCHGALCIEQRYGASGLHSFRMYGMTPYNLVRSA